MSNRIEDIDNLPYAFKVAIMPDEEIRDILRRNLGKSEADEAAMNILKTTEIDLSPFTEGMEQNDRTFFRNLVCFLLIQLETFSTAAAFVLLMREFFIPTAERERAMEKIVKTLGVKDEDHT